MSFEYLPHAAFVAGTIWRGWVEPACSHEVYEYVVPGVFVKDDVNALDYTCMEDGDEMET